jgi:hypothetical protein
MIGDPADMARRLRAVIPFGWFSDSAVILQDLLESLGAAWSLTYGLIQFVVQQTRILTATGRFLDAISVDFFSNQLPRRSMEDDSGFLMRIENELLRARGTRAAVSRALQQLTGNTPSIFEPRLTSDTGGYTIGGVGYGVAGGWGCLRLPFQFFVTAYRPQGGGISQLAGYGTGGVPTYGSLDMVQSQVSDAAIFSSIPPLLPAATIAWARIL